MSVLHAIGKKNSIRIFITIRNGSFFILLSAPEVMRDIEGVQRVYSRKADVWSMGAILYFMTYGQPPEYATGPRPPQGQPPTRDRALQDLLHRTLVNEPNMRLDTNDLLRHPFTIR